MRQFLYRTSQLVAGLCIGAGFYLLLADGQILGGVAGIIIGLALSWLAEQAYTERDDLW